MSSKEEGGDGDERCGVGDDEVDDDGAGGRVKEDNDDDGNDLGGR